MQTVHHPGPEPSILARSSCKQSKERPVHSTITNLVPRNSSMPAATQFPLSHHALVLAGGRVPTMPHPSHQLTPGFVSIGIPLPSPALLWKADTPTKMKMKKSGRKAAPDTRQLGAHNSAPVNARPLPPLPPASCPPFSSCLYLQSAASTLSMLAPVSVHASTYGCRLPSACITSTVACACAFFTT